MSNQSILLSVSTFIILTSALEFELFEANKCVISEADLIKKLISYHECLKHCKERADCTAISYEQKATLCRLNFGLATSETCQGYVYSKKVSWEKDDSVACRCPKGQQCKQRGGCVPSECSKLGDPDHGKVFGTQFSIGDKVTSQCYPGYLLQGSVKRVCTSNGTWSGEDVTCVQDPDCSGYLVSGSNGVEDNQLSESSNWCQNGFAISSCASRGTPDGMSARFARLNSTGYITGSWSAKTKNQHEYIQVDFLTPRTVSGIALQGRDYLSYPYAQFVKEFKVLYSLDCDDFKGITDKNGDYKRFQGNTSPNETVTRYLPERVRARCVRLNPTDWKNYVSLRFDVLGC